ncbi:O-antigen ligase like membrane protein [Clostridium collagenovorans DSM 3089]|uniref:O-antigen ligase like membrane protein n=1 Tax=Clostridium collagenovorans DSM 3089 TaxID=1121306 RepID=A0A1M5YKN2_9CLOT|nr:O-antigen ligase family protein [Clostridium collagenovorans]SHI12083.1 O-antigen ligase like membrane protein [Clostridium collagenovorans DSM 3089]
MNLNEYKGQKLLNIISTFVFLELILGGTGKLFYLPIRNLIFPFAILFLACFIIVNKIVIPKKYIIYIGLILIYPLYGTIVGLFNNNALLAILDDINVYFGILYLALYYLCVRDDMDKLKNLIDLFIGCSIFIALIAIVLFVTSYFQIKNGVHFEGVMNSIEYYINYGIISGSLYGNMFVRVYLPNGIFMQIALSLLLYRLLTFKTPKYVCYENIGISILALGIFATGTRGYWIGGIIVAISTILFVTKINIKSVLLSLILVVVVLGTSYIIFPEEQKVELQGRVDSISDFTHTEPSNSVRSTQLKHLVAKIKEKPVQGHGFGADLVEYDQETDRGGRNFELYYVELVYKTGAIGIVYLFGVFSLALFRAFKAFRKLSFDDEKSTLLKGWVIGFISMAVSTVSNPYFAGLYGFFIIVLSILIIETIYTNTFELRG